jgi:hypothetical protein
MRLILHQERTSGSADESAETWRKSSWSLANGNCVEVGCLAGKLVGVRDSKHPHGAMLRFTPAEWDTFVEGIRAGGVNGGGAPPA